MDESFRVIAIIAAFNEEDIISSVIGHLVDNGIDTYLIDNHSTDDTVKEASQWLGRGLVGIERFPKSLCPGSDSPGPFDWSAILRRKEELATELSADWLIHHDADEIRESPWPGVTLKEAIRWVDKLGYNCINFEVLNFCPVDDNFQSGDDPRNYFSLFENAAPFDKVQLKCWKVSEMQASLLSVGGHEVRFQGRRVFPISFLNRHYPIRGQRHGLKKVFAERKNRFLESERSKGWHIQYDQIKDETHNFLRDPETLHPFDLDRARFELMLPEKVLRDLADRLIKTEGELDALRSTNKEQEQLLAAKQHEVTRLAVEQVQFAQEADQLQQTIRRQEDALAEKDQWVNRITEDRERVAQELTELRTALQSQREKAEEGQVRLEQLSLDHERLSHDALNLQVKVRDQRQELARRDFQIIDLITQQDHSNQHLISMGTRYQETERELIELRASHQGLIKNVAILQGTLQQQYRALEALYGTLGWLLTNRLRPVKDKFLSPGSRLRQLYDDLLGALKDRLRNGSLSADEIPPAQLERLPAWEPEIKPAFVQPNGKNGSLHTHPVLHVATPRRRSGVQHFAIYTSSLGNYFFSEFGDLLAAGLENLGVRVDRRNEGAGFSDAADWHLIVAPHEFFYLGTGSELGKRPLPGNSILVNTEQPSTQWYARARHYFSKAYGIWDINQNSSQEIATAGYHCEYLPLGYLPEFKSFREIDELPNHYGTCFLNEKIRKGTYLSKPWSERPIDVLFLGTLSARREKFFVHASGALANHFCYLHLPGAQEPLVPGVNTPMDTPTSVGLAQRSKILLNIHRGADRYFEWHRIVMHGIWNQALVITEPCGNGPPFQPRVDFVEANISQIPQLVEYYLTNPAGQAEAEAIRLKAYQTLTKRCRLTDFLRSLLLRSCDVQLPEGSTDVSREGVVSA